MQETVNSEDQTGHIMSKVPEEGQISEATNTFTGYHRTLL